MKVCWARLVVFSVGALACVMCVAGVRAPLPSNAAHGALVETTEATETKMTPGGSSPMTGVAMMMASMEKSVRDEFASEAADWALGKAVCNDTIDGLRRKIGEKIVECNATRDDKQAKNDAVASHKAAVSEMQAALDGMLKTIDVVHASINDINKEINQTKTQADTDIAHLDTLTATLKEILSSASNGDQASALLEEFAKPEEPLKTSQPKTSQPQAASPQGSNSFSMYQQLLGKLNAVLAQHKKDIAAKANAVIKDLEGRKTLAQSRAQTLKKEAEELSKQLDARKKIMSDSDLDAQQATTALEECLKAKTNLMTQLKETVADCEEKKKNFELAHANVLHKLKTVAEVIQHLPGIDEATKKKVLDASTKIKMPEPCVPCRNFDADLKCDSSCNGECQIVARTCQTCRKATCVATKPKDCVVCPLEPACEKSCAAAGGSCKVTPNTCDKCGIAVCQGSDGNPIAA